MSESSFKYCGVASMPSRRKALKVAVYSMLPQVDKIYVYLNNYHDIPQFLSHEKIEVFRSQDHIDLGDSGKFFKIDEISGYYFPIDDDILYHDNYVSSLIAKIEQYKRKCVVGLHGVTLTPRIINYYKSRSVTQCKRSCPKDKRVHILGSGACGFHTDTIKVRLRDFEINNMADVWLGMIAQRQKIGMICIKRPKPLLTVQELDWSDSIFCSRKTSKFQTQVVKSIQWKIY